MSIWMIGFWIMHVFYMCSNKKSLDTCKPFGGDHVVMANGSMSKVIEKRTLTIKMHDVVI